MSANRVVRCYVCPDQLTFSANLPTGALFKGFIVRERVEAVFIVDPEVATTVTRNFRVVREDEPFAATGLTWLGMVDYRGTNWFVGEVV